MTVVVRGMYQGEMLELRPGEDEMELPAEMKAWWYEWIERDEEVGLPHWQRVPSFTEDEGFVAGCLALMEDGAHVQGMLIPPPDPNAEY